MFEKIEKIVGLGLHKKALFLTTGLVPKCKTSRIFVSYLKIFACGALMINGLHNILILILIQQYITGSEFSLSIKVLATLRQYVAKNNPSAVLEVLPSGIEVYTGVLILVKLYRVGFKKLEVGPRSLRPRRRI